MNEPEPEEIRWRVERAEGYLLLNMVQAARAQLESIPTPCQSAEPVREAWLQQAMAEKDWPQAAARAAQLRRDKPAHPEFWVWEAYARRRADGLPAARSILEEARKLFPAVGIIPYNLACYACVAGELETARLLLIEAFRRAPDMAGTAGEDEDLRPLWEELETLASMGG